MQRAEGVPGRVVVVVIEALGGFDGLTVSKAGIRTVGIGKNARQLRGVVERGVKDATI